MRFVVKGVPQAKQGDKSRIINKKDGTSFIHHYQPKKIDQYANNIRAQIVQQLPENFVPYSGLLRINKLHFIFPPLKGFNKKQMELLEKGTIIYKGNKPDLDNLEKAVYDAMQGIVFTDDKNIVEKVEVKKYYGLIPCIIIEIEEIENTMNITRLFLHRFLALSPSEQIEILQHITNRGFHV